MNQVNWLGNVPFPSIGSYIDIYLLIILGGIPWQVYFQRVLACRSSQQAQLLSYVAALGCVTLAIPSAVLGSVARVVGNDLTVSFRNSSGSSSLILR